MLSRSRGGGRRRARLLRPLSAALALAALIVAVVAGAPATAQQPASGYATTPASTGPVDPHAVPLGDGYVSTSPKVGYVDSCNTNFGQGGAASSVPWIDTSSGTWDPASKPAVAGSVDWPSAYFHVTSQGQRRMISFNALPVDTPTGTFPIAASDPAYQYDRNPNHISAHTENWSLPANPRAASKPTCTNMGAIGVLTNGVELFNALDAGGRDAGAHEVQDSCGGHPEKDSVYHYHDISSCILDKAPNGTSTLVGYALDGYGIYVVKDASGNLPTNSELDACHGTTSPVQWNGSVQSVYHYVVTAEYPYTIGCFHGTPIHAGRAKGKSSGGNGPRRKGPACRARPGKGGKGKPGGQQGGQGGPGSGQPGGQGGQPGGQGGPPPAGQQGGQGAIQNAPNHPGGKGKGGCGGRPRKRGKGRAGKPGGQGGGGQGAGQGGQQGGPPPAGQQGGQGGGGQGAGPPPGGSGPGGGGSVQPGGGGGAPPGSPVS